ncbi:MAG: uracil-DNA glycosylase [Caldithrix sp.]|nr:MAG: uracil-DNA glycosylase [Caldithrix sp.]TDI90454.1 MAG: uracil-DNA glycosylase [Caldithrix sp.]
MSKLEPLQNEITTCTKCQRLVAWREKIAKEKVRRFADETYWGKPIPSFGDPKAELLIVGLAPAAHGGNRTGRMFTGDRSGDWLFRALHKFDFANQPTSTDGNDGLVLKGCYITAALHCAPPKNKPTAEEKSNCLPYLLREIQLLSNVQVVIALGKIGFDTIIKTYQDLGLTDIKKRPIFQHAGETKLNSKLSLVASYHPSQQNTFTGRLTEPMFDAVFSKARKIINS